MIQERSWIHELSRLNKSGREIIDRQIEEEIQTSKLKEELELEQIELRLQIERNNESQQTSGLNTQSTSGLKSEDAVAPVFPPEAYGSRDTSLNKRCSPTSIYPKKPREAWTEMTPQQRLAVVQEYRDANRLTSEQSSKII